MLTAVQRRLNACRFAGKYFVLSTVLPCFQAFSFMHFFCLAFVSLSRSCCFYRIIYRFFCAFKNSVVCAYDLIKELKLCSSGLSQQCDTNLTASTRNNCDKNIRNSFKNLSKAFFINLICNACANVQYMNASYQSSGIRKVR